MSAENDGGIGGLDNTMEFHEITQRTTNIPTIQSQYLRDNLYRYYNVNENILMSKFTETEWNAFYESVIEPIALQLSLEFTFKLLTERERGFGNKSFSLLTGCNTRRYRQEPRSVLPCTTAELSRSTNTGN